MAVRFTGVDNSTVSSWSVAEDATSLDRGASDSGVPQLQVQGVGYQPGLMSMLGQSMTVISNEFGSTEFRITDIEGTESGWTLTGGSPLSALVQAGTIPSMTGQPFETIIEMFFNAVGIKRAQYTLEIDKALLKEKYDVPAQRVVVWQAMKQWLSANEIDMSWEVGRLRFQPLRNRVMYVNDVTSGYNLTMSSSQKVKNIDVNIYHRMAFRHDVIWPPKPLLYPDAKTTFGQTDTPVITVNAGEQTVTTLQLPCEVSSVRQPRQVMAIPVVNKAPLVDNQNTPNGIYMVVGKDNKAITPAQWQDMGGGLEVRLNKDKRSVDVIVTGMLFEELSPFRICESDGKTDYNGLFLLGENGTYVDIETIPFHTGTPGTDEEQTIDNQCITTRTQAYHAAQWTADQYSGHSLNATWQGINPLRDTEPNGERQVFGRLAGVRYKQGGHWWRVSNASLSDNNAQLTASRDTTLGDVQRVYPKVRMLSGGGRTLREISDRGIL